jgi:uncharacterized cupin superfamily protein
MMRGWPDTPRRVNIVAPECKQFPDNPDGFRPGIARIGNLVGAAGTGMSVYELPQGQAISPYHYENPEQEWSSCSTGNRHCSTRTERTNSSLGTSSSSRLAQMARTRVRNNTDSTARVLMFSNTSTVAASVYPDSDMIAIWTGNDDDIIVKRPSGVSYWDGESSRR